MSSPPRNPQLALAIDAIQHGNYAVARRIIQAELDKDPNNLEAWNWACEVAVSKEERIHCLEQIQLINPADWAARRQLARLKGAPASSPSTPETIRPARRRSAVGYLAAASQVAIVLLVIVVIAGVVYALPKSSLLGLRGPDFDSLQISDSFEHIESDDFYWEIVFEEHSDTVFEGLVRHNSAIHVNRFRILTQDILVTTGDYADPELVDTSVSNHRFRWTSKTATRPAGSIHLLHTVPATEEIHQQLAAIEKGDQVLITGREVLRINVFDLKGVYLGEWHDEGCNTLIVHQVRLVEK